MSEKVKYGKKPVESLSTGVRRILKEEFENVKESTEGFKINIKELKPSQVHALGRVGLFHCAVTIKRSGTGLVVFIQ